jgi:DNA-binding NarL/FixJ family response regulator
MTAFLIVDDHPLFREALRAAVALTAPHAEIFEATSIETALELLSADIEVDLILLDLAMPGVTGVNGLLRVRAAYPKLPVLVVSGNEDPKIARDALQLGIAGYVSKSVSKEELASVIEGVFKGQVYVPAHLRIAMEADTQGQGRDEQVLLERLRNLTPQQRRVLLMLREGLQNKQIAYELNVAETTVKAHVSEILRKLKVFSRTKAVVEIAKLDLSALYSEQR